MKNSLACIFQLIIIIFTGSSIYSINLYGDSGLMLNIQGYRVRIFPDEENEILINIKNETSLVLNNIDLSINKSEKILSLLTGEEKK